MGVGWRSQAIQTCGYTNLYMNKISAANFVKALEESTLTQDKSGGLNGQLHVKIDGEISGISIESGRVNSSDVSDGAVTIEISQKHFEQYLESPNFFSEAYTKGDFKPDGPVGSMFALIEILQTEKVFEYLKQTFSSS